MKQLSHRKGVASVLTTKVLIIFYMINKYMT